MDRKNELILSVFPEAVIAQASAASRVRTSAYLSRRLDLRGKTLFTFGGSTESNSEFAFSLYKNGNGWTLGVHIADIAEFVCEGSPLDLEARRRLAAIDNGFVHTDILPRRLRDVTDLVVGQDRLAVSVLLDIDVTGRVNNISFDESVVRVGHHCVYNEVDRLLLTSEASSVFALREKYSPIESPLNEFYALAAILYANRIARGGLDCPLTKRIYDRGSDGKVVAFKREISADIKFAVREVEFFVAEKVGEYMHKKKLPCIYLGQESADREYLPYLAELVSVDAEGKTDDELIAEIGESAKGTPYYDFVCDMIAVILPCVTFSDKPIYDVYCANDKTVSFMHASTRYADLLTLRALKTAILAGSDPKNLNLNRYKKLMAEAAANATESEQYVYDMSRRFSNIAALEYLEHSEKESFVGFPLYRGRSGEIFVVLECGLRAVIPSFVADGFDFEPAKPYEFGVIALGTEKEATVVKPM